MKEITGGCACGAVKYVATGAIEFSFNCHCRKCQRATGTGHAPAFAMAVNDIQFSQPVKEFKQSSDAGAATYSGFCGDCGSPICSRTERFPERVYILAASLDEPSQFKPEMEIFAEAAQPWDLPKG